MMSSDELSSQSRVHKVVHSSALSWTTALSVPHAVAWHPVSPTHPHHLPNTAISLLLGELFGEESFPSEHEEEDVRWLRDVLGKPYMEWQGEVAAWAELQGRDSRYLHLSNTHDGGAHIVLATYAPELVGLGIDAVYLPRMCRPGKDKNYLLRFARQFMSEEEWNLVSAGSVTEAEADLRVRVAAHFSLMEAASKACGTGLRIGGGIGRATSLPKYALGVRSLDSPVELLFEQEATDRMTFLGATRYEAHWAADNEFLVSVVLFFAPNGKEERFYAP